MGNVIGKKSASNTSLPQWHYVLVVAPSLAALIMHAYLGSFSRWIADDYCSGAVERRFGVLRAAWFWLRTWNGRYSADVLDAFFGYLGPMVTPVVTSVVLLLWLACLTAAIHGTARRYAAVNVSLGWSVSAAAAAIFLTLALAPSVEQSLYWAQGMRGLIPPLIILAVYVAVFAWFGALESSGSRRAALACLFFLLAYGAGGFSELFTALQVTAFALAILVWLTLARGILGRDESVLLVSGALAALLAFATMVLAPGNAGRLALSPPPPAFPVLLRISISGFGLFLASLVQSPMKLISLAGAVALGLWLGAILGVRKLNWRVPFLIVACGATLVFSCFPPAVWGTSEPPFDRTLIVPIFFLVMTGFLLGITLSGALARQRMAASLAFGAAASLLMVAAFMAIYQMAGVQHTYAAYAKAWSRFHAQMIGYRQDGVQTAQIWTADLNANNWAGLDVLGDNPKFWLNKCVSEYYGVNVTSNTP